MHTPNCDCDHCSARRNAALKAYNHEYKRNHPPGTDKHEQAMKKSREVLSRDPNDFSFNP